MFVANELRPSRYTTSPALAVNVYESDCLDDEIKPATATPKVMGTLAAWAGAASLAASTAAAEAAYDASPVRPTSTMHSLSVGSAVAPRARHSSSAAARASGSTASVVAGACAMSGSVK